MSQSTTSPRLILKRDVYVYDPAVKEHRFVEVEISIDIQEVARTLGRRAISYKSGKSQVMHGAIKGAVTK